MLFCNLFQICDDLSRNEDHHYLFFRFPFHNWYITLGIPLCQASLVSQIGFLCKAKRSKAFMFLKSM